MSEEPEQSYTTTSGSFGISTNPIGFSTPAVGAPRAQINEQFPLEEWGWLCEDMHHLSILTTQDKKESMENQHDINCFNEELRTLRTRVTNSYFRMTHIEESLQGIQCMIDRLDAQCEDIVVQSQSPRTAVVHSVFANRGLNEGSADYEHHCSAQIRFEDQGIREVEDPISSSRELDSTEHYNTKMAESHYRAAWKRPRGAHSYSPPIQPSSKGEDASDSEEHNGQPHETTESGDPQFNYYVDPGAQGPTQLQYNYCTNEGIKGTNLISAQSTAQTGSTRNTLNQDYAQCLMSRQP
jgi:hypothetical protein